MPKGPLVELLIIAVLALVAIWLFMKLVALDRLWVTVFEYQTGLFYRKGRLERMLGPGRYFNLSPATQIVVEDMREQLLSVSGQEVLTADNLAVKVSLSARVRVTDARLKAHAAEKPLDVLYSDMQVALRQAVAARALEALLADRGIIGNEVAAAAKASAAARGLEILAIDVRDVMLAGEVKRAHADIFRARKDGEAALERARGETAALRNLANGARMLNDNPALYNLRLLQALSMPGAKGATVVLNASGGPWPMPGVGSGQPPAADTPDAGSATD